MKRYLFGLFILLLSCHKDDTVPLTMTPIQETGKIVFLSRRMDNSADWQLVVMNADGTNQHLLSNSVTNCSAPVLSHDGSKVAFTTAENGGLELHIIDINGQNEKAIASGKQYCGATSWSPDDSHLLYVKSDDVTGNVYNIYAANTDGSAEVKLTDGGINFCPQFLPDGSAIVFSSSHDNEQASIYTMNPDGSHKKRLTPEDKSFGSPVVSPDGNSIAFVSNDWGGSQIFVMTKDGSHLKQLTSSVSPNYWDTGFPRDGNYGPVWSPDSKHLVYTSYANGSPDVFKINADGSADKRLTDTPLRDEDPGWTKDGNYILFSSNRNMTVGWEIYIMRTEGQLQTPLTNWIGDDVYPQFTTQ